MRHRNTMDFVGALLATILIVGGIIATIVLVAVDDLPAHCKQTPTPIECSGDTPPWQGEGDAPERGLP